MELACILIMLVMFFVGMAIGAWCWWLGTNAGKGI